VTAYRDHDEDDDWDDAADAADIGDDTDEEPMVPCPYCRREILEDAPRCPYCERYISAEDHSARPKPLWIVATALICLGVAIWWVFTAF